MKSRVGLPPPFIATEVGSRKSEVGSRKSEVRSQKSEDPPWLSSQLRIGTRVAQRRIIYHLPVMHCCQTYYQRPNPCVAAEETQGHKRSSRSE